MSRVIKLGRSIAISMCFAGGLTACGGSMFKADPTPSEKEVIQGQKGRTLWEAGVQYVKIVDVDVPGVVNEHPALISSTDMRTVLASLYVVEKKLFKKHENPLFSRSELQILSTAIANGLSQAASDEDITFVSIGVHPGALAKERKTTSGRVFVDNGRLNIIFNKVHEQYNDKDPYTGQEIDRRVNPLLPGTRKFDAKPDVRIVQDKGIAYYTDPETGKERSDWIVIDLETVLATAKERKSGQSGAVTPELREKIARNTQETRNLRHDVGNLKEVIFELSEKIDQLRKELEALKAQQ